MNTQYKNLIKTNFFKIFLLLVIIFFLLVKLSYANKKETVLIFAASSLYDSLSEVVNDFHASSNSDSIIIKVSYSGSAKLALQIRRGAPADIYISANKDWVDYLEENKAIDYETKENLMGNSLVLVTSKRNFSDLADLEEFSFIDTLLESEKRIAIGLTNAVPAGVYAKQALISLGIWNKIKNNLAQTDNIRLALSLVARGESDYGIVYLTDALAEDKVSVVSNISDKHHKKILYTSAVIKDKNHGSIAKVYDYLYKKDSLNIFKKWGFIILEDKK